MNAPSLAAPRSRTKLLAIDGSNLLRTVYEADQSPDSDAKGRKWSQTAHASFARALQDHPSSHVAVVMDVDGETWRHRVYPQYQANRKPASDYLARLLAEFQREAVTRYGIRFLNIADVDGDDVITTVVSRWQQAGGAEAVVLTTDKDMLVLINDRVSLHHHFKRERRDRDYVFNRFGIEPQQMTDYLALMGDSNDNIPGIAGIGAKTAAKLLNEYGSLDAIFEVPLSTADKHVRAVIEHAGLAELSRGLVRMRTDVVLGVTWRDLERREVPAPRLAAPKIQPQGQMFEAGPR